MPHIDLADLQARCWETAEIRGHHDNLRDLDQRLQTLVRLALVHTEISEAAEVSWSATTMAKAPLTEELADTAIRLLELCWCVSMPLEITPVYYTPYEDVDAVFRHCGVLHILVDRITQSVKRHGVTPEMAQHASTALELCWSMAHGLGADLYAAIKAKNKINKLENHPKEAMKREHLSVLEGLVEQRLLSMQTNVNDLVQSVDARLARGERVAVIMDTGEVVP